MNYPLSDKYDREFVRENIMGPNPIKLLEELLLTCRPADNSLVMDLGCGRGATSVFLAREYNLRVFATDLWIPAGENLRRFESLGLTRELIVPIHADAHALPYAENFFDAVISVDAYHYFGRDKKYLPEKLLPLVKPGGLIAICVPGLKRDFRDIIPEEMLLSWSGEDISTFHDADYWKAVFSAANGVEILDISQMESFDECWRDWLECDNVYARHDRLSIEAGAGKYMNFIKIIAHRKQD